MKPKLVFWLGRLRALGCIIAFLIVVPTHYLTYVFWDFILTTTKIVHRDGVNQVCTDGQGTNCCLTRSLIATIFSSFSKVLTRDLDFCQDSRLTINRLGFFFFIKFWGFFYLIGPSVFPAISIHLLNTGRRLDCSLRLRFNSLIKHFILEVELSM